jgi:predicted O-linked N-acetylglucosamine transferase (SPINDLY family)
VNRHRLVESRMVAGLTVHGQRLIRVRVTHDRAEACYRQVLVLDPQHTGALANLANLLSAREAIQETSAVYDRLFAIGRDWPATVWIRRAMAQNRAQDLAGAIESYREAARLAPDDMQVQLHLGTLYVQQRRFGDGEAALQRALELDPGNRYALSMIAHARQQRCDWPGLDNLFTRIHRALEGDDAERSFPACRSRPDVRCTAAQLHGATLVARSRVGRCRRDRRLSRVSGERLRVAFATVYARSPTLHLSLEFWEKIDRSRLGVATACEPTTTIRSSAARAPRSSITPMSVRVGRRHRPAYSRRSHRHPCRSPNGYTLNARRGIFPLRPAPLQINCIGPGTLGASGTTTSLPTASACPAGRFYTDGRCTCRTWPSPTHHRLGLPPPSRAACGLPGWLRVLLLQQYLQILPGVRPLDAPARRGAGKRAVAARDQRRAKANLRAEAQRAGLAPGV